MRIQNENIDLKIGYCLEPHDLAASKLAAGRDKDWPFGEAMLRHGIVDGGIVEERVALLPIANDQKKRLSEWVRARSLS